MLESSEARRVHAGTLRFPSHLGGVTAAAHDISSKTQWTYTMGRSYMKMNHLEFRMASFSIKNRRNEVSHAAVYKGGGDVPQGSSILGWGLGWGDFECRLEDRGIHARNILSTGPRASDPE